MARINVTVVGEVARIDIEGANKVIVQDADQRVIYESIVQSEGALAPEGERNMGSRSGADADAHHHIPIPQGVSEGSGGVTGTDRGHGHVVRDRGIHPSGGASEHRGIDGRAPEAGEYVEDKTPEVVLPVKLSVQTLGGLNQVTMHVDLHALIALIQEFDYHTFGHDLRPRAAHDLLAAVTKQLGAIYPAWRTAWPSKRNT